MKGEKQQNIVFGKAVFLLDDELIGLTRDGGSFSVEYNNRLITADGDRGAVKGRIHREEATPKIEINHLEILTAFEKMRSGTTVVTTAGKTTVRGSGKIDDEKDYHTVTVKGETKDGREFKATIFNAINLENIQFDFKDKDDVIDKVTFTGTYDPEAENPLDENWEIEYGTSVA